jgi:SAM-dependent methyltransferase
MTTSTTTIGTAERQGRLWSARSGDWADVQEPQMQPVFEQCLGDLGVSEGTRLLDVGCGAGLALRLAADRGADVSGLDAAEGMLEHARRRVPAAPLVQGEIEQLPFGDASFDIVTGFNSFQYAASPGRALAEAVRVIRPGGRVLAMVWGPADQCQSAPYLASLGKLMPPPPPGAPGPFALSDAGVLADLLRGAGLEGVDVRDAPSRWRFPDQATALRGLLSSGPAIVAIENSGEAAAAAAVVETLTPHRLDDGSFEVQNLFRYAIGTRP